MALAVAFGVVVVVVALDLAVTFGLAVAFLAVGVLAVAFDLAVAFGVGLMDFRLDFGVERRLGTGRLAVFPAAFLDVRLAVAVRLADPEGVFRVFARFVAVLDFLALDLRAGRAAVRVAPARFFDAWRFAVFRAGRTAFARLRDVRVRAVFFLAAMSLPLPEVDPSL